MVRSAFAPLRMTAASEAAALLFAFEPRLSPFAEGSFAFLEVLAVAH
jgi:hypothetical protein